MKLIFSVGKKSSGAAKKRLLGVVGADRTDVHCAKALERMNKELLEVLQKYKAPSSPMPIIKTVKRGVVCTVSAELTLG